MFHQDWGLFVWTLITFGLLLLVLSRFAFKPLGKLLEQRERTIRGSLDEARRIQEGTDKLRQQMETQLRQARETAQKIIDEGHRISTRIEGEATEKARRDADALIEQARKEIDREVGRGIDELRGAISDLSIRIARQFLRESLDEPRHREIVNDFLERMKQTRERG